MSLDPHHLLIGLAFGLVALAGLCLYLQRRLVTGEAEQALLEERLRQAISAQQGLTTQLDGYRVELAELSGIKSEQQAELPRCDARPSCCARSVATTPKPLPICRPSATRNRRSYVG